MSPIGVGYVVGIVLMYINKLLHTINVWWDAGDGFSRHSDVAADCAEAVARHPRSRTETTQHPMPDLAGILSK